MPTASGTRALIALDPTLFQTRRAEADFDSALCKRAVAESEWSYISLRSSSAGLLGPLTMHPASGSFERLLRKAARNIAADRPQT